MIRPLSSLHIATQDPCAGFGTEYSSSTLNPFATEIFRTGVASFATDCANKVPPRHNPIVIKNRIMIRAKIRQSALEANGKGPRSLLIPIPIHRIGQHELVSAPFQLGIVGVVVRGVAEPCQYLLRTV